MAHKSLQNIKQELKEAGATSYGLRKSEVEHLPKMISVDEKILGVIYGPIDSSSAMLIATDRRLLFVDVRPMHTVTDEMDYLRLADLHVDFGLIFARVTVYTGAKNFNFGFVNQRCARKFMNAIDQQVHGTKVTSKKKTERLSKLAKPKLNLAKNLTQEPPDQESINFLSRYKLAVISTYGPKGYPYGATVFYFPSKTEPNVIHIVSRDSTPTAKNIIKKSKVGLTITDVEKLSTLHIKAVAEREPDFSKAQECLANFINTQHLPNDQLAPVNQIKEGGYVVLRLTIHSAYLHAYQDINQLSNSLT